MGESDKRYKTSTRNFIIALILLLATNVTMGVVILYMSKTSLQEQISERMLDVANTAAHQINGDDIRTITAADEGTYKWKRAMKLLSSFQDNIKLKYIYAVRKAEDGSFIFVLDPDKENPASFGDPIKVTEALRLASDGTASVNKESHTDFWGRFYSAYCPIYDSNGDVSGVIGVDFDADWFDDKVSANREVAVILIMVAMTIGVVLSFTMLSQNRKKFAATMKKIDLLYQESQKLDNVITRNSITKLEYLPKSSTKMLKTLAKGEGEDTALTQGDEYDKITSSLDGVYEKLHKYLEFIETETVLDDETGVYNRIAYKKKVSKLSADILKGNANFSVAFFDLVNLKEIYRSLGYEKGDAMLYDFGRALENIFGKGNVYHIMGYRYIIVAENKKRIDMEDAFKEFDKKARNYRYTHSLEQALVISKGYSTYDSEKHKSYRDVFAEAKAKSDKNKEELLGNNKPVSENNDTVSSSE